METDQKDPIGWGDPKESWTCGTSGTYGTSCSCLHEPACSMANIFSKAWWRCWQWINTQGIVEEAKCDRFYLTLSGDAYFGMKQLLQWTMIGTFCKCPFTDNSLNLVKHKNHCFKDEDSLSLIRQLIILTPMFEGCNNVSKHRETMKVKP